MGVYSRHIAREEPLRHWLDREGRVTNRMESMRDLSSALWSLRTNQEAARLLRTSLSLLRWLLFFLLVLAFLFLHLAQVFYRYHFNLRWEHLFLVTYCLFSCWRHIHKQYLMMAFPLPEQVVVDVESVVRDYLRPATSQSPPGDLPPKYEE